MNEKDKVAIAYDAELDMHVPIDKSVYKSVAELCADHSNLQEYITQLEEDRKDFNQVMAEALENAFVEGWEGCILSGEVSNKYQWKRSDAKKLADNLLKGT